MILPAIIAILHRGRGLAWMIHVAVTISTAMSADLALSGARARDVFSKPNLLHIEVTVSQEGVAILGQSQSGGGKTKPKAKATVEEGGRTYHEVEIQLKGFTTFQSIDNTPSLTLDFNQYVPGQRFYGMTKISLNNSLQDPTRLHEKFAREIVAAAGVPVPQADHALVTLNGRPLGLYVLVEGYGKSFLKRHFSDATGRFYEGEILRDLNPSLPTKSSSASNDRSDVARLLEAARVPDAQRRYEALDKVLDLERFISLTAVETMLCHSDSYSMNRNNYRIYHDPISDRFVFMPHGMDRILGTHRSNLDLPVVPPAIGVVARALLSTPEGRRRYVARAGTLFTNLFQADRLCRRIREMDAKISSERKRWPGNRGEWGSRELGDGDEAADMCRRLQRRISELGMQFAQSENLLELAAPPKFGTNGVAWLDHWRVRWILGEPSAEIIVTNKDNRVLLRVRSGASTLHTLIYSRVVLERGNYRVLGGLVQESPGEADIQGSLLRYHASDRFTTERPRMGFNRKGDSLAISSRSSPEEVELVYEIRSNQKEVWLDSSRVQLIREEGSINYRRLLFGE